MRLRTVRRLEAAHARYLAEKAGAFACQLAGPTFTAMQDVFDACDLDVARLAREVPDVSRREGMSYAAARVQHAWWREHVVGRAP